MARRPTCVAPVWPDWLPVPAGQGVVWPWERIFDDLPNMVFFAKDVRGRYTSVNRSLVERCGFSDKAAMLGKRPSEIFPASMAAHFERQDARVLGSGKPVLDQLELHFHVQRRHGWCLTNKYPLAEAGTGKVVGLVGVGRDVETSARGVAARGFPELARAIEHLQGRVEDPPGVEELAAVAGLPAGPFAQMVHRVFHMTPRDLIMKVRLDEAMHLLAHTGLPLAEIALSTGFCDQSAFTRHFRRFTGIPPGGFRARQRGNENFSEK